MLKLKDIQNNKTFYFIGDSSLYIKLEDKETFSRVKNLTNENIYIIINNKRIREV